MFRRVGAPWIIAHRGASAHAPEHTVAAYDLALAMGADVLELDVRTTADGTPVVLHDPTLARTAGLDMPIAGCALAELSALPPAVRPLTLDAVLARYGRRTRLLVELKDPGPDDPARVASVLARHPLPGRIALQSFDHAALRRAATPARVPAVALFRSDLDARAVARRLPWVARFAAGIAPAQDAVDAALVASAHARGLSVQPYTVNARGRMAALVRLGVDGVITDLPDVLRAVVRNGFADVGAASAA